MKKTWRRAASRTLPFCHHSCEDVPKTFGMKLSKQNCESLAHADLASIYGEAKSSGGAKGGFAQWVV